MMLITLLGGIVLGYVFLSILLQIAHGAHPIIWFPISLNQLIMLSSLSILLTAVHTVVTLANIKRYFLKNLNTKPLDSGDLYHRRFKKVIDELQTNCNMKPINPVVWSSASLNAFSFCCSRDTPYLGISEGLLWRLSRSQLQLVVAQQVAQIRSGDCYQVSVITALSSLFVFPQARRNTSNFSVRRILLYVFYAFINQSRQFRADAAAVAMTKDPIALAQAIMLIERKHSKGGCLPYPLRPLFIMDPYPDNYSGSNRWLRCLMNCHPSASKRLDILCDLANRDKHTLWEDAKQHAQQAEKQSALLSVGDDINIFKNQNISSDSAIKDIEGAWFLMSRQASQCPDCPSFLLPCDYEGCEMQRCRLCEGSLINEDHLARVIIRQKVKIQSNEFAFSSVLKKKAYNTRKTGLSLEKPLPCPTCEHAMAKKPFRVAYPIEIDHCGRCNVVWLNGGKLELLQYLVENKKTF